MNLNHTTLRFTLVSFVLFFCIQLNSQLFHDDLVLEGNLTFQEIVEKTEKHFDVKTRVRGQGYKQFQRWKYWAARNLDENGKVRSDADALRSYNKFAATSNTPQRTLDGNFIELGPLAATNTSTWSSALGRISAVGLDVSDDAHIIVGAPTGGIWKTLDYGATWTPLFDEMLLMDVFGIEISHADPDRYWVGLSDGILTSTDGGTTWTAVGGATSGLFNTVEMHPMDADLVFAVEQGTGRVHRSEDGGDNFSIVMDHNSFMYDLEFHPSNPDIIYASGNDAMYISTDTGASFSEITTGPWNGFGNTLMMAVTPAAEDRIYVLEETGGGFNAVYMSENLGSTWTTLSDNTCNCNNIMGYDQNGSGGQGPRDMDIIVSPVNPDIIHVAGVETWRSTNLGESFIKTTNWSSPGQSNFVHADVDLLMYDNERIIAGTDGGIYVSTDDATSWTDITPGIGVRQFYRIGASATEEDQVSGGSQDNGTGMLKDGIWFDFMGADGMETFVDWSNPDVVYGTVQFGALYKSVDGAQSLANISTPGGDGNWVTPFEQDPVDANVIYTAREELWKSENGGSTWTALTNINNGSRVDEFKVSPVDNNYLFLTSGNVMRISTDGGNTWTTSDLPAGVNYIAVHPLNPERLAIAVTGSVNKIYESFDAGTTWNNITGNYPDFVSAACVLYDQVTGGLFAGGNPGIYHTESTDAVQWEDVSFNLPKVRVTELEIRDLTMYVATYGRGLWKVGFECDENVIGKACNDSDPCTSNDVYDENCNCAGVIADSDGDGVCDALDVCEGGDDNEDWDHDGIPNFCDGCATDCPDSDCDAICDEDDICPGGDDALDFDGDGIPDYCDDCDTQVGQACDDNDPCTVLDTFDENCNCIGVFADADADGVCDELDLCPNGDDTLDADDDGLPDDCDHCPNPGDTPSLFLEFLVDTYPGESTWEVRNTLDEVVTSSFGNYAGVTDTVFEEMCVDPDCYEFIVYDTYGDGICCGFGQGHYILTNAAGDTIAQGGEFDFIDVTEICIEGDLVTDLTMNSLMLPTTASGLTTLFFAVTVFEVGASSSEGDISIILPKDDRLPIDWDPSATIVGPSEVDNAMWTYDGSDDSFHIWTNTGSIPSNGSSTIGFSGNFDPQATTGLVSFTATILENSGGEQNGTNNIDVETLIYFSN